MDLYLLIKHSQGTFLGAMVMLRGQSTRFCCCHFQNISLTAQQILCDHTMYPQKQCSNPYTGYDKNVFALCIRRALELASVGRVVPGGNFMDSQLRPICGSLVSMGEMGLHMRQPMDKAPKPALKSNEPLLRSLGHRRWSFLVHFMVSRSFPLYTPTSILQ